MKARGYRIRLLPGHQRGRDGVMVDTGKRLLSLYLCPQCKRVEETKRYHLELDDADATIVSWGVVEDLAFAGMIGPVFEITNEVVGPPRKKLVANSISTNGPADYKLVVA